MASDIAYYAARFEELKQDGCAILVTGDVPVATLQAAVRTLMGAPDEPRRRVLAVTDPGLGDPTDLLPAGSHPVGDRMRFLDYRDLARAADAVREDSPFAPPADLDSLQLAIHGALADLEPPDADGGEIRLSVSSLVPLLDRHDDDEVRRFVRATAGHARGVHGMAHYLLPVTDTGGWVRRLTPAVDLRVELREPTTDGPPEHRWHFPERDHSTPWRDLPIAPDRDWTDL